jgi:hypothetical protein
MSFFRKFEVEFPSFKKLELDFPGSLTSRTANSLSQYEKLIYFGQISVRLQQTTTSAQQFVYFSGLIAAAIVSAGLVGKQTPVVILAPYALTFALTYQIQLYTDVECLTTLKEHLELSLNAQSSTYMYLEGAALSASYRNRLSVKIIQFIYIALIAGVFAQSIRTSYKHQARWTSSLLRDMHIRALNLHILNVCGILICTALLAIASLELAHAHSAAQERIKAALSVNSDEADSSPAG